MFARSVHTLLLGLLVFALLVHAAPPPATVTTTRTTTVVRTTTVTAPGSTVTVSQCNTGPIQCCESTHTSIDGAVSGILGLLGIVLQDITGLIGLNCSPLNVLGLLSVGGSCAATPVCCQNNTFNGLIVIGCSPIIISL